MSYDLRLGVKVEGTDEVEIGMRSPASACTIRNLNDHGTLQLVLPVREIR